MLKSLIASTLILAVAVPVKAQVGPGSSNADYIAGSGGGRYYASVCTNTYNGRLSLRTGPGKNYPKIKEIPNGHTVALNYSEYDNDGFRWWNANHKGSRGWVRADYVCGDPEDGE